MVAYVLLAVQVLKSVYVVCHWFGQDAGAVPESTMLQRRKLALVIFCKARNECIEYWRQDGQEKGGCFAGMEEEGDG